MVKSGHLEGIFATYVGGGADRDPVTTTATTLVPAGNQLSLTYGIADKLDVGLRVGWSHLGGDARFCFYRSKSRKKMPYWVATADLGYVVSEGEPPTFGPTVADNRVIYPGITIGRVAKNLEGYARIRYYYSLEFPSEPRVDPHIGLDLGLRFKTKSSCCWFVPLSKSTEGVVFPLEMSVVLAQPNDSINYWLRMLQIGGGVSVSLPPKDYLFFLF